MFPLGAEHASELDNYIRFIKCTELKTTRKPRDILLKQESRQPTHRYCLRYSPGRIARCSPR